MPISEDLDAFFPQDSSKVSFSVSGVASQDSVLLTIRTWPSRSAADISGLFYIDKNKVTHWSLSRSLTVVRNLVNFLTILMESYE